MQRRKFLQLAGATMVAPAWISAETASSRVDLRNSAIVLSEGASTRESKAAQVLVEEAAKRCGITWPVGKASKADANVNIYLATRQSVGKLAQPSRVSESMLQGLKTDGFLIKGGQDASGQWIAVVGADERGLL